MQTLGSQQLSFSKESLRLKRDAQKRKRCGEDLRWSLRAGVGVGLALLAVEFVAITAWGDILELVVPDGKGWVPVVVMVAGLAIGWLLAFFKRRSQSWYAIVELVFAAISFVAGASKLAYSVSHADRGGGWAAGVTLVGALYVASRAFANRQEASDKKWGPLRETVVDALLDEARELANQGEGTGEPGRRAGSARKSSEGRRDQRVIPSRTAARAARGAVLLCSSSSIHDAELPHVFLVGPLNGANVIRRDARRADDELALGLPSRTEQRTL